jgi:hypothetical protein
MLMNDVLLTRWRTRFFLCVLSLACLPACGDDSAAGASASNAEVCNPNGTIFSDEAAAFVASLPPELQAPLLPSGFTPRFKFTTKEGSTQNYTCGSNDKWDTQHATPAATLVAPNGAIVGEHGAGPRWTWTWCNTTHMITGMKVASVPAKIPGAVPWLVLSVQDSDDFHFVLRVDTSGGTIDDTAPCEPGATQSVTYSAAYYIG